LFNELELLELRLHELWPVVDHFVVVEATRTHSGKPKPLYFEENRSRFSDFRDKIIYIRVEDMPVSRDAWVLENFQRNCIRRGLAGCRPDDFILVSDLDEIPRASTVEQTARGIRFRDDFLSSLVHGALNSRPVKAIFHRRGFRRRLRKNHPFVLKFEQEFYRHFLNCRVVEPWYTYGPRMVHFRDFSCAEEMRHSGYQQIKAGGWHFSFMGGAERIREKLEAYAHQERNLPQYTDPAVIESQINRGDPIGGMDYQTRIVPLDDSFPRYVLENREKFAPWIRTV
jgi:beta-1,4-mannosyl-glycoprotein beta-1,4-N-acetylglucosaminyltransferase